jgi:hypothetical protein
MGINALGAKGGQHALARHKRDFAFGRTAAHKNRYFAQ